MTVESGLSTGPTTSTYHVLCSSRGERTRCFSSVFKRLTLPQTLFVEKTKQLILNFKIRHVCFSKKLLKPTMPRSLKQGLRRPPHPACQAGARGEHIQSWLHCTPTPTRCGRGKPRGSADPVHSQRGFSPEALGSQMPPEPLPLSPQWGKAQTLTSSATESL